MRQNEAKEAAERYFKIARKMVLDGEDLTRVFFVSDDEGNMNIIAAPCGGPEADTSLIGFLRIMFAAMNAVSYCMVSEVWVSENPAYVGQASQDPNRKEAVIMLTVRRVRGESGEYQDICASGRAMIERDPLRVGDLEWGDAVGGRFTRLLPAAGMPKCPKDIQKEILGRLGQMVGQMGGEFQMVAPDKEPVH